MPENNIERRTKILDALKAFAGEPLPKAASCLLASLGYSSDKTADLGSSAEALLRNIEQFKPELGNISRDKIKAHRWKSCSFLFQLTNDEIPSLAVGQATLGADIKVARSQIESFVFVAIGLKGENWSRTDLASITRELNRRFPMPSIIIFAHGGLLSLAVIDRRQNLQDSSRDVIDSRITVIKDVRLANPHRAHIDILSSLALENLGERRRPSNFRDLYDSWIEALSTQALNKRFYTELAWWYFWAVKQVDFPKGGGQEASKRNSVAVIRMLTRLIFVWFIKEKGVVPEALFERETLKGLMKTDPDSVPEDSSYYLAILQNLFFATLNVEMGADRKWAVDGGGMKGDRLIHSLYRHKEIFKDADTALKLFSHIPFLNGGLFECLDRDLTERDFQRNPELKQLAVKEGNGWVLRVDGFSRRADAQPKVPNKIFFGGEEDVDLNSELGASRQRRDVYGLIDLFSRYKFTVDENTPVEEEVALDPELLGKVFENLLASYNEDTKTTARKQSGSFYTPREVVDYMVDEALIAYFERHIPESDNRDGKLRRLLSYTAENHSFSSAETSKLIAAIESLKILDPACGSGAFPMGVLTKLVHVLKKLDPDNALWQAQNLAPLQAQLGEAKKIPDPSLRDTKVDEAEAALEKSSQDFANTKHADYTRKLYLIEKCIHGVDIQPIAVQIAKLRFFIALVVSQEVDPEKDNLGITALPNLETKIVAADSLTPVDRPAQMGLRDPAIDQKEKELTEANEHYFAARTGKTKRRWRDRIFQLRDELAGLLESDRFLPAGAAKQLVHWNPFDQNAAADFFDPEWMFQIDAGFDITIGNPPYVNAGAIRDLKPGLRRSFGAFFDGNADLFTYFYRRGFDLLAPKGVLVYISSNKFMRTGYGAKTRKLLAREGELLAVIDFGEQPVFGASVDSAIVVVQKPKGVGKPKAFKAVAIKAKEEIPFAGQLLAERGESYFPSDLPDDGWLFESSIIRQLLKRIEAGGKRLDDIIQGHFYYGIKTGFNEAFVIDSATRERLIREHAPSADLLKPWLDGNEIHRWRANYQNQYVIAVPSSANHRWPWSSAAGEREAERIFAKTYPALWAHFSDHVDRLKHRTDQGQFWWELRSCSYWDAFDENKLVFNETSKELHAFIDDAKLCINKTGFIIVNPEQYYLLGVLNSSALDYHYRHNFPAWGDPWNGGRIQFRRERMVDAPIPWPDKPQRDLIAGCVKAVSAIYKRSGGSVTGTCAPRFEQLINGLVFELFFSEDLHAAGIRLFDACEKAGVEKLAVLNDQALSTATTESADRIFATSHPLYAMLYDLQALDIVRIIEGRE